MDWIRNINNAIEYIEENLKSEIDIDDVASVANSSKFHFSRIFKIITNKTIKEYIRERRISVATQELVTTNKKISKISEAYLYESPAAFSKAFKRYNRISPNEAKSGDITVFASPKIKINVSVTGSETLKYRIKTEQPFSVSGIEKKVKKNTDDITKFWKETINDNIFQKKSELIGITYNWSGNKDIFSYLIGTKDKEELDNIKLSRIKIPESKWAVFTVENYNENNIVQLWKNIYSNWLPATNYVQANNPVLEIMKEKIFEIWLPLKTRME